MRQPWFRPHLRFLRNRAVYRHVWYGHAVCRRYATTTLREGVVAHLPTAQTRSAVRDASAEEELQAAPGLGQTPGPRLRLISMTQALVMQQRFRRKCVRMASRSVDASAIAALPAKRMQLVPHVQWL